MDAKKKYELYVEGVNDKCVIASIGYQRDLKPSPDRYELKFGEHIMAIKNDRNGRNSNDSTVFNLLRDALTTPQQFGAIAIVVDADDFKGKRTDDRVNTFFSIIEEVNSEKEIYDLNVKLTHEGLVLTPKTSYKTIFPGGIFMGKYSEFISPTRRAVPTPKSIVKEDGTCEFGTFDKEFEEMDLVKLKHPTGASGIRYWICYLGDLCAQS